MAGTARRFRLDMRTATVICLILAIVFIISLASEVFIDDLVRPQSAFGYLLISSVFTGILATILVETIDVQITR